MKTGYLMIEGTGKKWDQHLRTIRATEGHSGWKVKWKWKVWGGGMVVGGLGGKKKKQIGPFPIQGD